VQGFGNAFLSSSRASLKHTTPLEWLQSGPPATNQDTYFRFPSLPRYRIGVAAIVSECAGETRTLCDLVPTHWQLLLLAVANVRNVILAG
jgi:hypothetical protein